MSSDKETRNIGISTKQMLWGMAAGRCEKTGCNKILYESPVTHIQMNNAQIAHNAAHSKNGPRGMIYKIDDKNDLSNLLLLCPDCHKEIDTFPEKYPVELLKEMKQKHEERIRCLTSITSERECITVIYSSSIAKDFGYEGKMEMLESLSNIQYYSSINNQIIISAIEDNIKDGDSISVKVKLLKKRFQAQVQPAICNEKKPIAVFALAPIPLLVYLGTLFPVGAKLFPFTKLRCSDRNGLSWRYEMGESKENPFEIIRPNTCNPNNIVALALETTDVIDNTRITDALKITSNIDIWRIRHNCHGYDLDCTDSIINSWIQIIMNLMNKMRNIYGFKEIHIFPAINNALAIALGKARVEKTDSVWVIYDNQDRQFHEEIHIGGTDEF